MIGKISLKEVFRIFLTSHCLKSFETEVKKLMNAKN